VDSELLTDRDGVDVTLVEAVLEGVLEMDRVLLIEAVTDLENEMEGVTLGDRATQLRKQS